MLPKACNCNRNAKIMNTRKKCQVFLAVFGFSGKTLLVIVGELLAAPVHLHTNRNEI